MVLWIVAICISIIISIVLGRTLGKGEDLAGGIDGGFEINFSKLSSRRKCIRTIHLFPFVVLIMFYFQIRYQSYLITIIGGLILTVLVIIQFAHYYKKWKSEEQ